MQRIQLTLNQWVIERAKISMHALSLSRMLEKLYGGSKAIPLHAKRVVSLPKTIICIGVPNKVVYSNLIKERVDGHFRRV